MYTLSAIYVYPIKSMAGISFESAHINGRAIECDRQWMLVDENGKFISQRSHPILALFVPEIKQHHILITFKSDESQIEIPINSSSHNSLEVTLWDSETKGIIVDPVLDKWFSEKLNEKVHLVRRADDLDYSVNENYANREHQLNFTDGFPYLILGEESLKELNKRCPDDIPMNRFRPNLVFKGGSPHDEDNWHQFKINELNFKAVKPCTRCKITTTDQNTGIVLGQEPLKTLASYRQIGDGVHFGMNLLCTDKGVLKVGDILETL